MKMKKMFALGAIAPMFAMCVSCSKGINKISFDEALNFAIKNYDQYSSLGYSPIYILKVNKLAIEDTKIYSKIIKDDGSVAYEQTYYLDTTIRDFATTIDTDELNLIHVNSEYVVTIQNFLGIANGLLGYFDAFFTLEDNKYLGIYAQSNKLEQVICLAGFALPLIIPTLADMGFLPEEVVAILSMLKGLSSTYADIKLTASCNNLGLLDRAYAYLEIDGLSFSFDDAGSEEPILPIDLDLVSSKKIAIDVEFIVDYSGK